MRQGRKIEVVIPALNEEQAIVNVISDIPDWVDQIVVGDNGSSDQTAKRARAAGAIVVLENERGYGAACLKALAVTDPSSIIVFLDGDYSDFPQDMAELVDPILAGKAHMVIGSRVTGEHQQGSLTPVQVFGNGLACWLIKIIWGMKFTDLGPFRAIEGQALRELHMQDRNYGWTVEMQIKAARSALPSLEVPVRYRQRIGFSKVSGTIKGSVLAGSKILGLIARYALFPPRENK